MILDMSIALLKFNNIVKQFLTEILMGLHALMGLCGKKEWSMYYDTVLVGFSISYTTEQ